MLSKGTTLNTENGYAFVSEERVIAVDGTDSAKALTKAADILKLHGWMVAEHQPSDYVTLTSNNWPSTEITIYSIEFVEDATPPASDRWESLQRARKQAGARTIVVADVARTDGR
ncbi:hypothetical protein [Spongiactinospora gelatinilytica]|uniref:hypothetical protein n=1 Tax=Spongiactinospora gelatinilytica TaxID=2666298 RepID=UPI0011B936D4|nr:hypothetical protein [Spongiactinospora gelatinilytica]